MTANYEKRKILRQINYLLFKINSFRPLFPVFWNAEKLDWNANYTLVVTCISFLPFIYLHLVLYLFLSLSLSPSLFWALMEIWFEMTWNDHCAVQLSTCNIFNEKLFTLVKIPNSFKNAIPKKNWKSNKFTQKFILKRLLKFKCRLFTTSFGLKNAFITKLWIWFSTLNIRKSKR